MSLHQGKQDIQALTVTYSKQRVYQQFQFASPFSGGGALGTLITTIDSVFEYHRYAKRSYKYNGLTQGQAKTLAQSILNSYNRTFWISQWYSDGDYAGQFKDLAAGKKVQGAVYAQRAYGCFWEVVVEISEDDVKMDRFGYKNPEELFANENNRSYEY